MREHRDLELYVTEDEPQQLSLLQRYSTWSSLHTMNPFAWPWVICLSIIIWLDKRAQKNK